MNRKNFPILFLIIALTFSCKSQEKATGQKNNNQQKDKQKSVTAITKKSASAIPPDSLFAFIQRGACYGTCPAYKMTIYKSGYAVYEGQRFVTKIGTYEAHLSQQVMEGIKNKAKADTYFQLEDEYVNSGISDLSYVYTKLHFDGKKKEIKAQYGSPDKLIDFQKYMDSVMKSTDWKKKN